MKTAIETICMLAFAATLAMTPTATPALPAPDPAAFPAVVAETTRSPAHGPPTPSPELTPVTVAPTVTPSASPVATPAGEVFLTQCAAGSCGPARRVAAAPVRFVGRAFANRPRPLARLFGRRR